MQPFDPKLYDSQNEPGKKPSGISTDRAVDRTREADEGRRRKAKKFKLDDGEKEKKRETKNVKKKDDKDLPSAFDLAKTVPKKKLGEKKKDAKPFEEKAKQGSINKERHLKDIAVQERAESDQEQAGLQAQLQADDVKAEQAGKRINTSQTQLDLLMKQLVDAVTVMKVDGKTETTLLLKNPPLFAGAKLTVTGFDSAKGEFNITFSELNAQAKQLLDMQEARNNLIHQLEDKGYVMHIMITTTEKEDTLPTAEAQKGGKEERESGREEDRRGEEDRE